jgi:benzylsuccinate CoA-transferase BbsF subunit
MTKTPKALEGVKVVVIGAAVTAPTTGKYLALHGATVVRLDSHSRMDGMRTQRPFPPNEAPTADTGVWWANVNTSTLCVGVDWKLPTGKKIVDRLLRWADVVIENFSAGTLNALGFGYEAVSIDNPGVIYLSSCLLGQTGPLAPVVGLGTAGMAFGGFVHLTGWADLEPTPIQTQYTDFINPRMGAAVILAALDHRRRTGKGQYLDQAQVEGGLQFLAPLAMDWFSNGRSAMRSGNRILEAAPHHAYPCKGEDRWCFIGVFNDNQWHGLGLAMGQPAWSASEKFGTVIGRKEHEDELDALIGEWTKERTSEEVEAALQAERVPSSVVENSKDTREDAQLAHRGFFRRIEHSVIGEHTYRGPCFRLSKTPDNQFAGPALGQHNFEVCTMVGMDDEEIAEAIIEGGLGTEPVSVET